MKSSTKSIIALVLSLSMLVLFFLAGIPEVAAFFTITSVLLIEVVRYEVRISKPVKH